MLGLAGRNKLSTYLDDFLSLLGYWATAFFVIIFTEHVIFRKANFANYNLEGWNDPKVIPVGIAALCAFLCGVMAFVMGMVSRIWTMLAGLQTHANPSQNESWFIGPLCRRVPGEGDVANELTLVVTFVVFVPLRYLEKKFIGR